MSNRFSQWAPTEYVPLPLDYYQQDLAVQDSNVQSQVDSAKQVMYALRSVTPTGKDATALHEQIMNQISEDVSAIGKMNLKTPEALTRINGIVNNPEYTTKLRQIYQQTELAKKWQEAAQKHIEETGNDVNALPYLKSLQALQNQKGDASAFNPDLFSSNVVIPKYVEVQPEIDKTIEHMKANGYTDVKTGNYITTKEVESLSPERIQEAALQQLGSRTDLSLQLNRNIDYTAFNAGGMDKLIAGKLPELRAQVDKANKALKLASSNPGEFARTYGLHGNQIQEAKNYYAELASRGNATLGDINNPAVQKSIMLNDLMNKHAKASSSLFSYYKEKLNVKADPFALQRQGAALDMSNYKQKKQMEFDMLTKMANDQTGETDLGTSGALSGNYAEDQAKDKDGTWLNDMIPGLKVDNTGKLVPLGTKALANTSMGTVGPGGMPTIAGLSNVFQNNKPSPNQQAAFDTENRKHIIDKAKQMGWNGSTDIKGATDYLHAAWAKNKSVSMPAYFNTNLNATDIGDVLSSGFNGLSISRGNKDLTTTEDRMQIHNDITGFMKKKDASGNIGGKSTFMATVNPRTHKPSFTYTDPRTGEPVFIEMPKSWKQNFGNLEGLTKAILDPNYKGGTKVNYGGKPYSLFRLPESGTSDVFAVADTDEIGITNEASAQIRKVANTLYHHGVPFNEAMSQARTEINKEAAKRLGNHDLMQGHFVVNGVNLGDTPFMVLSDVHSASDTHPSKLHIGTLIPTPGRDGKPYGGQIIPAGDLMRGLMVTGMGELSAKKAKAVNIMQSQTTKEKSKFSFTNSNSQKESTSQDDEE